MSGAIPPITHAFMPCIGTHLVGRPCTAYGLCHSVAVPTYVNDANAARYQVVRRVSVDFFVQQCENLTEEVTLLFPPPHFISKSVFDIPVQPRFTWPSHGKRLVANLS